jgi:hypothetical protein
MTMISARLALFRWVCPLIARKDGNTNDMCSGCGCPVWRFREQPADPDAMRAAMLITGEKGLNHKIAARLVADEPERFGHAVGDERLGWCGLGGKPEVAS